MDGRRCARAVQFHHCENLPSLHNKKENQGSRVLFLVQLLIAIGLQTLLASCPITTVAQTLDGHNTAREKILGSTGTATPNQSSYPVSVPRLRVPAKVVKHLASAHKRFSKSDLRGATQEIERALEIEPDCAQAFSMRAVMKLALKEAGTTRANTVWL